jgi:hypothetical protein
LLYNSESFQVTDTYTGNSKSSDSDPVNIDGLSPVAFLVTSHIDPRLTVLDNAPDVEKVKLVFLYAKYGGPFPGTRTAHITQELGYINELGIMENDDNHACESNSQFITTTHELVQFFCNLALMSEKDSAQPATVDDD